MERRIWVLIFNEHNTIVMGCFYSNSGPLRKDYKDDIKISPVKNVKDAHRIYSHTDFDFQAQLSTAHLTLHLRHPQNNTTSKDSEPFIYRNISRLFQVKQLKLHVFIFNIY